ncbi:gp53-like domain-containing protein [Morganella morganii]|uniref:gp53-like domain-containing protein n=1 Tax=Morganella morganii TaxID=582 RepID=UPI00339CF69D
MSVMNKPDYKIFAQDAKSGEYVAFPDILRGWGITLDQYNGFPPMELFNSAAKRIDEWLMYLTQRGLPEWDAAVDYPKDAMIQHAGVYYVSLKATKGEQPNNSQASWKKLTEALGVDGKLAKDQNGADIPNKPKFIENLGLPELLDKKFDKTGGVITASSAAVDIRTKSDSSGYFQISDTSGKAMHQIGKTTAGAELIIRNVTEEATVSIGKQGVKFNGSLLGIINTAFNGNNGGGWWRCGTTGVIIQWGRTPTGATSRPINFPIPFTDAGYVVNHFDGGFRDNTRWGTSDRTKTGFIAMCNDAAQGGNYIAIGF